MSKGLQMYCRFRKNSSEKTTDNRLHNLACFGYASALYENELIDKPEYDSILHQILNELMYGSKI